MFKGTRTKSDHILQVRGLNKGRKNSNLCRNDFSLQEHLIKIILLNTLLQEWKRFQFFELQNDQIMYLIPTQNEVEMSEIAC
jgi:hypothetical protein